MSTRWFKEFDLQMQHRFEARILGDNPKKSRPTVIRKAANLKNLKELFNAHTITLATFLERVSYLINFK